MKAYLLAAGYGTRLRPITNTIPKCMVPIRGQPLLGWWFDLLCRHGVTEVLVNTHYLPEPVRAYMDAYNRRRTGLRVFETYEPALLGSAGTVWANRSFVQGERDFLICYADNLTDADLTAFLRCHERCGAPLTMALFHTNLPEQCGIVQTAADGRIVAFTEKPEKPVSSLANAGMYAADSRIFDYLDGSGRPLDFGRDILPKLVGNMYGWNVSGYQMDIGTLENYQRANEEWGYDHYEDAAAGPLRGRRG